MPAYYHHNILKFINYQTRIWQMARFLTTRGTTSEIENIINNASKGLVLMSPFVRIPSGLFQNLLAADKQGINITMIYGKKDLENNTKAQLRQLKNANIYYLENLHAKCYFNEQSMVITSLNPYDFSEQNKREMGVLVTNQDDKELFNEALREAQRIISLASPQNLAGKKREQVSSKITEKAQTTPTRNRDSFGVTLLKGFADIISEAAGLKKGYCIRCGGTIPHNLDYTYCSTCFSDWVKHGGNPNYIERNGHCHTCGGEAAPISRAKPECNSCFWG